MESDAEIVEGLRRGDAAAFDLAFERHRARLFSFLARLSRDREAAEEISQETWLRLARHARGLEEGTSLPAWLFTVGRNLWISHRRWQKLDLERLLSLRVLRLHDADTDTPFDLASASETERRLEHAIGRIPPAYREVLLLVAVERFEPAQVAVMLRMTPEAVRQRLARARAMIAERLGDAEQKKGMMR